MTRCLRCGSSEIYYFRNQFLCSCGYIKDAASGEFEKWENDTIGTFLEDCAVSDFKKELDVYGK